MFAGRYFAQRYFAPRYWPPTVTIIPPAVVEVIRFVYRKHRRLKASKRTT